MKTSEEYIEELESLVDAFAALAKFHELATVDSRAVELLLHADSLSWVGEEESDDSKAWLEELRVANSHELT